MLARMPLSAEWAGAHHQFERRPSYASQPPHAYGPSYGDRPTIELPRPMEPRPTHLQYSSRPDSHQDAFHRPSTAAPNHQGQSLPGLRDILTPAAQPSYTHQPAFTPPFAARPPPTYQNGDGHNGSAGWHPPMTLHPSTETSHPPAPLRRLELPVRDTSPVPRHQPQSLPTSPYTTYPDAREYVDARYDKRRQQSSTSFVANGAPSPYITTPDNRQLRGSTSSYDRTTDTSTASSATESQRKYLGTKTVAGEGDFHIYEGGYRIPTKVDGEQVNPAWGLTKANKPRKRLALACLDCREKKIKCEPGATSCLQCEKAKRPCRRAPNQQPLPDSSVIPSWQGSLPDVTPHAYSNPDTDLVNKRRSREDLSPSRVPAKKHRSASPRPNANGVNTGPIHPSAAITVPRSLSYTDGSPKAVDLGGDVPPIDLETTVHLVELYFAYVNNATYALFPRDAFMRWVKTNEDRSENEQMVLYAMLAAGANFDDRLSGLGKRCAEAAKDALAAKTGVHTLQIVQIKLLLGLYYYAHGMYGLSWDYTGSAIRSTSNPELRLNEEQSPDEIRQQADSQRSFGLSGAQLAECRRRSFWACFLADRYEDGMLSAITLQDIFVRLPCADDIYERGLLSDAPFYNNGIVDSSSAILTPQSQVSPMAWLALVSARWGDVLNFTNRAVHRSNESYREAYQSFYEETHGALSGLISMLPEYLQCDDRNIMRSIEGGYASDFIMIHALYHFTLMRLNRCIRHAIMPDRIATNIRAAHYHAHSLLTIVSKLYSARQEVAQSGHGQAVDNILTTPFLGCAIMSAIDVIGAGGAESTLNNTIEVVNGGLDCLRELAKFWSSARDQFKTSERRFYEIKAIVRRPTKARSGAWLGPNWGIKDPLEKDLGLEYDCIYGLEHDGRGDGYTRLYFAALRE